VVNGAFLRPAAHDQFRAGIACPVAKGWLSQHESGTYVKFTPTGAELFA